jgi:hypothetical protein
MDRPAVWKLGWMSFWPIVTPLWLLTYPARKAWRWWRGRSMLRKRLDHAHDAQAFAFTLMDEPSDTEPLVDVAPVRDESKAQAIGSRPDPMDAPVSRRELDRILSDYARLDTLEKPADEPAVRAWRTKAWTCIVFSNGDTWDKNPDGSWAYTGKSDETVYRSFREQPPEEAQRLYREWKAQA